jgi:hypothetical protein
VLTVVTLVAVDCVIDFVATELTFCFKIVVVVGIVVVVVVVDVNVTGESVTRTDVLLTGRADTVTFDCVVPAVTVDTTALGETVLTDSVVKSGNTLVVVDITAGDMLVALVVVIALTVEAIGVTARAVVAVVVEDDLDVVGDSTLVVVVITAPLDVVVVEGACVGIELVSGAGVGGTVAVADASTTGSASPVTLRIQDAKNASDVAPMRSPLPHPPCGDNEAKNDSTPTTTVVPSACVSVDCNFKQTQRTS